MNEIVSACVEKLREGVDPTWLIRPHLKDIMLFALKALATFQSFMLQGKPDPEHITKAKDMIKSLFASLTELSDDPEKSFFDANISQVISDSFVYKRSA